MGNQNQKAIPRTRQTDVRTIYLEENPYIEDNIPYGYEPERVVEPKQVIKKEINCDTIKKRMPEGCTKHRSTINKLCVTQSLNYRLGSVHEGTALDSTLELTEKRKGWQKLLTALFISFLSDHTVISMSPYTLIKTNDNVADNTEFDCNGFYHAVLKDFMQYAKENCDGQDVYPEQFAAEGRFIRIYGETSDSLPGFADDWKGSKYTIEDGLVVRGSPIVQE